MIAALSTALSKHMLSKFKKLKKEQEAQSKGIQALLRDRIETSYYYYQERSSVTLHGLENVNAMYEEYQNLGGNGTVTKLVEDIRKLPVLED